MARYIDADKLEKDFPQSVSKHNVIINGNEYPVFLVDHVLHKIRNYPAADVVEVKHGRWIDKPCIKKINNTNVPVVECAKCGISFCDIINNHRYMYRYCPNCGAKMDGTPQKEG